VLFIVSNIVTVRFERQTMTDGMPVCIILNPASYNFASVERSEREREKKNRYLCHRKRARGLTYLMM
jgi:hypothetical protein